MLCALRCVYALDGWWFRKYCIFSFSSLLNTWNFMRRSLPWCNSLNVHWTIFRPSTKAVIRLNDTTWINVCLRIPFANDGRAKDIHALLQWDAICVARQTPIDFKTQSHQTERCDQQKPMGPMHKVHYQQYEMRKMLNRNDYGQRKWFFRCGKCFAQINIGCHFQRQRNYVKIE